MKSIESLNKLIAGREKAVEKLTKKMERIEKAAATNWEVNPYCYDESDLKWTGKELDAAKQALADYRQELAQAIEKANSRNVKPILDFLETWKLACKEWYKEQFEKFLDARREWAEYSREYTDWINNCPWKDPKAQERKEEYKERRKEYVGRWSFIFRYIQGGEIRGTALDEAKISKELDMDANAMYDDIIERTNREVGTIVDASGLSVGEKGDLNGFIVGERGTAKVTTIGAGGWNIQRFHFRTLIHKVG